TPSLVAFFSRIAVFKSESTRWGKFTAENYLDERSLSIVRSKREVLDPLVLTSSDARCFLRVANRRANICPRRRRHFDPPRLIEKKAAPFNFEEEGMNSREGR